MDLPTSLLSHNGDRMGPTATAGQARPSVWWTKAGIKLTSLVRGHREVSGTRERMYGAVRTENPQHPVPDLGARQWCCGAFHREFNEGGPREALHLRPSAEPYQAWPQACVCLELVPEAQYPSRYEVRQGRYDGCIKCHNQYLFVSEVLIGKAVEQEEIDEGTWSCISVRCLWSYFDERDRV